MTYSMKTHILSALVIILSTIGSQARTMDVRAPVSDGWTKNFPVTATTTHLVIRPDDPKTLFAASPSISNPRGLWKSNDGGLTWTQPLQNLSITNVAIDPCDPDHTYVTYNNILQWSLDGGETWNPSNQHSFGLFDELKAVVACNNMIIVALAYFADDKIRYSTDSGGDWHDAFSVTSTGSFIRLAFDSDDPQHQIIYALHNGMGVFKSTDSGLNWNAKNSNLPACTMCLYTADLGFSGGITWVTVNSGSIHGLYKSSDQAETWTPVYTHFNNTNAIAFEIDKLGNLIIGTNDEGFLSAQGVFLSDNGGISFQTMNEGLDNLNVYDFAYASNENMLYAATDSGIWQYQLPAELLKIYLPMIINNSAG